MFSELNLDHLLDNMPGLIWVKDRQSKYVACNKNLIKFAGLKTKKELVDQIDDNLPWAIYAKIYREADEIVLNGHTKTFLHPIRLASSQQAFILSKKSPVYDQKEKIVGINGQIYLLNSPSQLHSLINLNKLDLSITGSNYEPVQYIVPDDDEFFNLSRREAVCLFYLIRGKTAKEIADILFISKRTVESHLTHIKDKFNCRTKSEVINKAIDEGFIYFVPCDYLLNKMQIY